MYHDTNENQNSNTFVVGVVTAILGIAVGFLGASILLKPSDTIVTQAPATDTKAANFRVLMNGILKQRVNLLLDAAKHEIDNEESELSVVQSQIEANSNLLAENITSIYGKESGESILELLRTQAATFGSYAKASGDNNAVVMDEENNDLTSNAESLATKLSEINSELPKDAIGQLIAENNVVIKTAIDAYAAGNFAESYTKQNEAVIQAGSVADAISGAIVKHSTAKFE